MQKVIDTLPWPVSFDVYTTGFDVLFTDSRSESHFSEPSIVDFLVASANFLEYEGHGPERMERVAFSLGQCFDIKVWEEKGYLEKIEEDVREMFVQAAGTIKEVLDEREWDVRVPRYL
ncbi:hypothetical protein CC2G_002998 [Coprinopsis cinerea AmutBmut pab1-1]|nr:hypothetical protein CC2G_002998 [Coprinopsis cinerea AmutBmut pab1-1]